MSDDLERLWSRYAHVWGWITIALLVGVSLFLTFAGEFLHLHGSSGAYLKAIGGSLLASVVFYSLISLFLEPKQRALQAMPPGLRPVSAGCRPSSSTRPARARPRRPPPRPEGRAGRTPASAAGQVSCSSRMYCVPLVTAISLRSRSATAISWTPWSWPNGASWFPRLPL